jgi:uncharacterized protein DUF4337
MFNRMPEESLETGELQEKLEQALERAEEAGEERAFPKWTLQLSLSTALVAVMAAIASLQAGSLANHALIIKNEAVLAQAKASDQWAYYQAKGIKAIIYQVQGKNLAEANRYKEEQAEIKKEADEIEAKVKENNELAEHFLHRHHQFALSVTFFQVAIALAAIASLTRRKGMWYLGLAIAAAGLMFFFRGWL